MSSAWSQLEQLLTCAICLDRFKNPKLLPCQHTFCGEPCMEGLVDYARRQIKCPECRAEHRIPYQGIQTFPTNVTLMRFLELHQSITGEEPEPVPSMMERCGVCTEKSIVERCSHCDKKICTECKEAHLDILKREISRINSQVRRALARLEDNIGQTDRNSERLVKNQTQIRDEIEETVRRFVKDLKDKEGKLLHELDEYVTMELKGLSKLKEELDIECKNIEANCELLEKHVLDQSEPWTDAELVEYKDIFNKSLDFLRNVDTDTSDYSKRIKFQTNSDLDVLRRNLVNFGELKLPQQETDSNPTLSQLSTTQSAFSLNVPPQNALMRSQSDHRLAAQFARREGRLSEYSGQTRLNAGGFSDTERENRNERSTSPTYGRNRRESDLRLSRYNIGENRDRPRYGRDSDSIRSWNREDEGHSGPHFRSRFMRERGGDFAVDEQDSDYNSAHRSVRFEEPSGQPAQKVFDTQEAIRGPLSGVVKLSDSAHFMERVHENEVRQKVESARKEEESRLLSSAPTSNPTYQPPAPLRRQPSRQVSEDEIEKQKKANKAEAAATAAAAATSPSPATPPVSSTPASSLSQNKTSANLASQQSTESAPGRYMPRRVTSLREEEDKGRRPSDSSSQSTMRDSDVSPLEDAQNDEEESSATRLARRRRSLTGNDLEPRETSAKSSAISARAVRSPMAKNLSLEDRDSSATSSSTTNTNTTTASSDYRKKAVSGADSDPRQTAYYNRVSRSSVAEEPEEKAEDEDEENSESESEREEREESDSQSEAEEKILTQVARTSGSSSNASMLDSSRTKPTKEAELPTTVADLLTRSAQVRKDSVEFRSRLDAEGVLTSRLKHAKTLDGARLTSNTGPEFKSNYYAPESVQKRYTLANGSARAEDSQCPANANSSLSQTRKQSAYATNRTNSLKDDFVEDQSKQYAVSRRDYERTPSSKYSTDGSYKVLRSKSSHSIGGNDGSDDDDETTTTSSYRNKHTPETSAYSRSRYQYRTREPREPRDLRERTPPNDDHSSGPSAWSQYLRNKYANSRKSSLSNSGGSSRPSILTKSKSSHAVYNRTASDSSDDEGTNFRQSSRESESTARRGPSSSYNFALPRSMYLQKRRMAIRIGSRGTEPGCFTWPRGVAVGLDNNIVVADSSNHRIQVFDSTGRFLFEFGSYGSNEGEFDCPAGVAVNRIGQFIVSDRYNHRVQIFDPSGRFLRAFGCEGRGDGRFSYPWGITTDSLGFIYICDKENHRIQVFQSDGTFVGKFGSIGSRPGLLEHPHYIAVSNTNRVIVSDSNNHRIQIFDVNGRSLSTFGTEGSEEGQFKFPRGIGVDDQGYIIVGDSGNNRIQIFNPDGSFLKSFGAWGSGEGEFKGLEGVAVTTTGNILVCDRENHRIQVF